MRSPEPLPGYKHPSEMAYRDGCGCEPCKTRRRKVGKLLKIRKARGPVMTDTVAVADRLRGLMREGFSAQTIAHAAHVDESRIHEYAADLVGRMRISTAVLVLNLTRQQLILQAPDKCMVPSIGATRRVQALMRAGWPNTLLAEENPVTLSGLHNLASNRQRSIRASNHRIITAMFDRYAMRPGPSRIVIGQAKRLGYHPPLAWSDDTIDDPTAQPNLGAPNRITPDQWLAEALHLWDGGVHPADILRRTNLGPDTARKRILQHNPMHPLVHGFNQEIRRAKHAREQEGAA